MSKEAAGQPMKAETNISEAVTPIVEKTAPVAVKTKAAPRKPVATAAAAKEVATKQKPTKKAVAKAPAPEPRTAAKPAKKVPDTRKEAVEAPKAEKATRAKKQAPKKPKLVRDSFTIPETDYALFASLKQRALTAGIEVKKSEILRAAVVSLAQLDDAAFAKAIGLVERIKTGRPKK